MTPMQPMRADNVRMAKLSRVDRASGLQPEMLPVALKNQLRAGPKQDLLISKNKQGAWSFKVERPGVADSMIMSKAEQRAMSKVARSINSPK